MIADIDTKEAELRRKDDELAECYRTIAALKEGGAEEGELSRELGLANEARADVERRLAQVGRELEISESLVGIREETIAKLKVPARPSLCSLDHRRFVVGCPVG